MVRVLKEPRGGFYSRAGLSGRGRAVAVANPGTRADVTGSAPGDVRGHTSAGEGCGLAGVR
jgi:hypothetical protein